MRIQQAHQQYVFVVRIWQETHSAQRPAWRGMVEHVPDGQRIYFTSLNDLSDFIALQLDKLPKAGQSEEKS